MPPLANAKARVADELRSSATTSESRQTMLCVYLSAGLLLGLSLKLLGWWWADPITGSRPLCSRRDGTPGAESVLHGVHRWL
jgi:hypothetical protein